MKPKFLQNPFLCVARRTNSRFVQAIACSLVIAPWPLAQAVDRTWGGSGSTTTTTDLGLNTNWSGATLPDESSTTQPGDRAVFNGTRTGVQTLVISTDNLDAAGNGNDLYLTSTQTDAISMDSSNSSLSLRLDDILMDAGAGALTLGDGSGSGGTAFAVTLGGGSTNTDFSHTWTNNSGNLAQVRNDVVLGQGQTTGHTLNFAGSGNWTIDAVFTGASLAITKDGGGTLRFNGANTYTGGTTLTNGAIEIGVDSVGSVGAITSSAVGTGALTINGGAITARIASRTLLNAVTVGGDFTLNGVLGGANKLTLAGGVGLGAAVRRIAVDAAGGAEISGAVSNGGIVKAGTGMLILSGTNLYTGTTTIENGILRAAGASAFGTATSAVALGNATSITSNFSPTLQVNSAMTLARDVIVGASNVTTNGVYTIDTNNGSSAVAVSGLITLNQSLTISGNTSGGFTVGNITSGSAGTQTVTFSGNSTGVFTGSGVIGGGTGTIALVKSGGSTLTLSNTNSYTGGTTIGGGVIVINSDAALGTAPGSPATNLTFSGSGNLRQAATTSTLILDANRNIVINTGATATFSANGAGNVMTIAGSISNQSNTGNFSLATSAGTAASGIVVLTGSNNFAVGTTVSLGGASGVGGGILRLANSNALGSNAVTVNGAGGGGPSWGEATLELSGGVTIGNNVTFNIAGHTAGGGPAADNLRNFSGNNTFNGAINITTTGGSYQIDSAESGSLLTLGGNITNQLPSLRVLNFTGAGNILSSGSFVEAGGVGSQITVAKSGTGTLTLSGSNSYTGPTTVSAGTLYVDGSLGNSAVTVSGGTFGGTGTVAGSVTVGAATYAPGASPGSMEIAGDLTLSSSSTTNIELGGTAFTLNGTEEYDRTKLTGATPTLTLSGVLAVSLFGGFTLDDDQAFGIFQLGSGATRAGTFTDLAEGSLVGNFGGKDLFITYQGDFGDSGPVATSGGNDIVLYSVPEPRAAALGALATLMLLRRRQR